MMNCSPCKGCEKRVLRCHSTCEAYKAYTQEREEIRRGRAEEGITSGYEHSVVDRHLREMERRRR